MTEIQEDKRNSHVSSPSTIRYAGFGCGSGHIWWMYS